MRPMVTLMMSDPRGTIRLPRAEELRAMLSNTAVAITVVICTTLVAVAGVGGMIYLAATGHGTEAFGAFVFALLGIVWGKVNSVHEAVKNVQGGGTDAPS